MTQTILVTGGLGFISSAIVRVLLERNNRVINLDAMTYSARESNER
jgi:dTDP-glucose 4,6-dehydratase